MKLRLLVIISCLLISSVALAKKKRRRRKRSSSMARAYGMAGCGLGSKIFKNHNSKFQMALANLTNVTFLDTFAMTSGTSNCTPDASAGMAQRREQIKHFIGANKNIFMNQAAQGSGEMIEVLSHLYGCESDSELGRAIKQNYSDFKGVQEASEIRDTVENVIENQQIACHEMV